jgi:hypothetical protein
VPRSFAPTRSDGGLGVNAGRHTSLNTYAARLEHQELQG